jgi:excreted virulence factor EspC (type VII ESX diderm)
MEPGRLDPRHNVVLADTTAIRALAAAHSRHAADLDAVAATLRSVVAPACATTFGPVGARFLAALAEAVARESATVAQLSDRLTVADHTAAATAAAYGSAERRVGHSITAVGH